MTGILALSIGMGLAVGLLFAELFGVAAGGMVVPGYIALYLGHPTDVLITVASALFCFGVVKLLSPFIILYGRRRTAIMILVGYLVTMSLRFVFPNLLGAFGDEFQIIGFIIPGLLAIWMDRQGAIETISTLTIVSVIIRLILILILGEDLKI